MAGQWSVVGAPKIVSAPSDLFKSKALPAPRPCHVVHPTFTLPPHQLPYCSVHFPSVDRH